MALTKIPTHMLFSGAASEDLSIDADTLYIDSSTNRVGIANNSPSVALDVTGAAKISSTLDLTSHLDMPDDAYIKIGTGDDLQLYHNASDSIIRDAGTGRLLIGASELLVTNSGLSEAQIQSLEDGAVTLYHNGNAKLATASGGVTVTGNIANASGDMTIDVAGDIILDAGGQNWYFDDDGTRVFSIAQVSSDVYIGTEVSDKDMIFRVNDGGSVITALTLDGSDAGTAIFNHDIKLGDDDVIKLGDTAGDFELYHIAGSVNVIRGNGGLVLQTDDTSYGIQMGSTSGGETMFKAVKDGAVTLYYDNSAKLATASDGVDITGDVGATTATIAGNITQTSGDYLYSAGTNFNIKNTSAEQNITFDTTPSGGSATEIMRIKHDGTVGIGTASPSSKLHINSGSDNEVIRLESTDTEAYIHLKDSTGSSYIKGRADLRFEVGGNDVVQMLSGETVINNGSNDHDFRVESNGNANMLFVDGGNDRVGIGNASPSQALDLQGYFKMGNSRTDDAEKHAKLMGVPYDSGGTSDIAGLYINGHSGGNYLRYGGGVDATSAATTHTFYTAALTTGAYEGTHRLHIAADGKIGMGTTTPGTNHSKANNLVVGSGSAGGMAVYNGTAEGWYAFSRDNANNSDAYDGGISYNGDRQLKFHTNAGGTRMMLNSDGLHFGSDTAAANALDDYEEGTFTPTYTVGGGGSVTGVTGTNAGTYTKVGRMCTVSVTSNYVGTSGTIPTYYLLALPFTAADTASGMAGGGFGQETGQSGAGMLIKVEDNSTNAIIWRYNGTAVPANSYFSLSFTYQTT